MTASNISLSLQRQPISWSSLHSRLSIQVATVTKTKPPWNLQRIIFLDALLLDAVVAMRCRFFGWSPAVAVWLAGLQPWTKVRYPFHSIPKCRCLRAERENGWARGSVIRLIKFLGVTLHLWMTGRNRGMKSFLRRELIELRWLYASRYEMSIDVSERKRGKIEPAGENWHRWFLKRCWILRFQRWCIHFFGHGFIKIWYGWSDSE